MKYKHLDLYLENESLKNEFAMSGLDVAQV